MTWEVVGTPQDTAAFGSLEPEEVLFEFDGPRIYTARLIDHSHVLVYQCSAEKESARYFVVPLNDAILDSLVRGQLPVCDALDQPWSWLIVKKYNGALISAAKVPFSSLPSEAQPKPGVFLQTDQNPILSVRLIGEKLKRDAIPASVVKRAVDGATAAIKKLMEWALEVAPGEGRPEQRLRRYYDLPIQRFQFASFEVSFGSPLPLVQTDLVDEEAKTIARVTDLLNKGLLWASDADSPDLENSVATYALVDALDKLVPPKHGVVTEVRVGGKLTGSADTKILTRISTDRVRGKLKEVKSDIQSVRQMGYIREFDKDKFTFILRDVAGKEIYKCSFDDQLYDDALTVFEGESEVEILGHESKSRKTVDVISLRSI